VIQVVQFETSTQVSSSASGNIDTGLTGSITPTSSTSKILVIANLMVRLDGSDPRIELFLTLNDNSIIRDFGRCIRHETGSDGTLENITTLTHVHSPNTVSNVEYKIRFQISSGSSLDGGAITFQDNSQGTGYSTMTLMEIAG